MAAKAAKIAVLGAGMIGCWIGGHLARSTQVTLIGRGGAMDHLANGMRLTDSEGLDLVVPPAAFQRATGAEALAGADLIIVSVKSGSTGEAAQQLAVHAGPEALVLSLQNGVSNTEILRKALPGRRVLGGMVPYNVAQRAPGHFHRGTGGAVVVEDDPAFTPFQPLFGSAGITVDRSADILAVQWGKLLVNLNNAINALSGATLAGELSQRDYRRSWALSLREGLKIVRAAGIRPADPLSTPLSLMPLLLSLPDGLYRRAMSGRKRPRVDRHARSSMADDLARGRRTEVDHIQGEIVRLAEGIGWRAPVNARLVELVRAAEQGAPPLPPGRLLAELRAAIRR